MMIERGGGARSILYICDFNAHGGTQTHLLHLFESVDRRRFRPSLVTLNLHPSLGRRLAALDVEVTDLRLEGAFRPSTLRKAAALAGRARREGVDLLHGCLFQGNLLTAAVSTISGVPCVTSVRNVDLWKKRRHHLASAAAHRRAARVVFNSEKVRDHTLAREGIPLERTVVIYNGVADATEAREQAPPPVAPAGPTVLCVASLRPKKGHADLLEAFREVVAWAPGVRLVLAGEGPLRADLEARVERLGLKGSVLFEGYRPDVGTLLRHSDLFVMSSLEEGMPNALIEAMSAGLACVATDVGGVGEVIVDGRTGFLVPPARPAALAMKMSVLLKDAALRAALGLAGRRRYESLFTLERMAAAYQTLYDDVLAG